MMNYPKKFQSDNDRLKNKRLKLVFFHYRIVTEVAVGVKVGKKFKTNENWIPQSTEYIIIISGNFLLAFENYNTAYRIQV